MEYVSLRKTDLEIITEISQDIVDYKYHCLSRPNWLIFESQYLPSLVQQLADNKFKIVTANNNTLTWLLDQIVNSRKYQPGVKKSEMILLADTAQGESALSILRAARFGVESYNRYCHPNQFYNLFNRI